MEICTRSWAEATARLGAWLGLSGLLLACGAAEPSDPIAEVQVATSSEAITVEDGLADAYAVFKQNFTTFGLDQRINVGYGFHAGLSTEKLPAAALGGQPPSGNAAFDFTNKTLSAVLHGVPAGAAFDLWFVKNIPGAGRSFIPESGDQFLKVGSFAAPGPNSRCFGQAACLSIDDLVLGSNIDFDLDLMVVTRKNQLPSVSRIAVGARTLFEKRFYRERQVRPSIR